MAETTLARGKPRVFGFAAADHRFDRSVEQLLGETLAQADKRFYRANFVHIGRAKLQKSYLCATARTAVHGGLRRGAIKRTTMKFLALIPARYASTRFPGKPLADLGGKPMIRHVYEKARAFFDTCYVATDDERIERAVAGFGGRAIMTSTDHRSGTDRCREALDKAEALCGERFDIVVNIQGDEPFVSEEQLSLISGCFDEPSTQIATLVKAFAPHEDIFNSNSPKVVLSADGHALYFSRSAIPFLRGVGAVAVAEFAYLL